MKISFDLDDTLIPSKPSDFQTLRKNWFQKLFGIELLRKGTIEIFNKLQKSGHEVGIYTTSFRSKRKIRLQMRSYGIRPEFIINEDLNRKVLTQQNIHSSKYPPAFQIDLHIDDSFGVKMEGEKFGFRVIVIDKIDLNWNQTILDYIK